MKIKVNFGKIKTILLIIVAILSLTATIINILFLAGVGILTTNVPVVVGVSLGFSILIFLFAIMIFFTCNYFFKDTFLKISFAFLTDKIEYEAMTDIKEELNTKDLYIVFNVAKDKSVENDQKKDKEKCSVRLLVDEKHNKEIIDFLRKKNPQIMYDNFEYEPKKKGDETVNKDEKTDAKNNDKKNAGKSKRK